MDVVCSKCLEFLSALLALLVFDFLSFVPYSTSKWYITFFPTRQAEAPGTEHGAHQSFFVLPVVVSVLLVPSCHF